MALGQVKQDAKKVRRQSLMRPPGKQPEGIKKTNLPSSTRKSPRLQRLLDSGEQTFAEDRNTKRDHRLPSPTGNTSGKEFVQNLLAPPQAEPRKRKQLQGSEAPDARATRPLKRLRTAATSAAHLDDFVQTTVRDSKTTNSVQSWINGTPVPKELPKLEEKHTMNPLLARKRSSSSLRSGKSDGGSARSAIYMHASYSEALELKGSSMNESASGMSDESEKLCRTLLAGEQTVPPDSLFRDDLFEKTCRKLKDQNEARVVQDIARLIVPSVETLATYGASHLDDIVESVNEAWAFAIPILGPRPQPDYAAGFGRSAFEGDRLEKLFALTGKVQDTSPSNYRNTWRMYFSFLTSEVKCGAATLDAADRQNAHSMAIAGRAIDELFRSVKREEELNGRVFGFSISHDASTARIYAYYTSVNGPKTTSHRHTLRKYDFTERKGIEKWVAHRITKGIYDWAKRDLLTTICSAIDQLPSAYVIKSGILQQSEPQPSEGSGLSQSLHSHHLSHSNANSTAGDDDSQSSYSTASEDTPSALVSHGTRGVSKKKRK